MKKKIERFTKVRKERGKIYERKEKRKFSCKRNTLKKITEEKLNSLKEIF